MLTSYHRRAFLKVGGGLALAASCGHARAAAPTRAKACILIYLLGGPPQLDTFDLKPSAPAEIRGPFRPCATRVPGQSVHRVDDDRSDALPVSGPKDVIDDGYDVRQTFPRSGSRRQDIRKPGSGHANRFRLVPMKPERSPLQIALGLDSEHAVTDAVASSWGFDREACDSFRETHRQSGLTEACRIHGNPVWSK